MKIGGNLPPDSGRLLLVWELVEKRPAVVIILQQFERNCFMRGDDQQQFGMFSYVSFDERVPAEHPLRSVPVSLPACGAIPLTERRSEPFKPLTRSRKYSASL
jgi:hypothetical protein